MTIKVEITAANAVDLAAQLNEFVQTFVNLARSTEPTPFDATKASTAAAPEASAEPEKVRRTRKPAPVIDASAEPAQDSKVEKVTPEMVRSVLNQLRTEKGNEALGSVVTLFAPKFSEIPETSYPKLFAEAKKALAA